MRLVRSLQPLYFGLVQFGSTPQAVQRKQLLFKHPVPLWCPALHYCTVFKRVSSAHWRVRVFALWLCVDYLGNHNRSTVTGAVLSSGREFPRTRRPVHLIYPLFVFLAVQCVVQLVPHSVLFVPNSAHKACTWPLAHTLPYEFRSASITHTETLGNFLNCVPLLHCGKVSYITVGKLVI